MQQPTADICFKGILSHSNHSMHAKYKQKAAFIWYSQSGANI